MTINLKIPARVNILGNPSDANEGDFATISAAVDIFAYASIEKAANICIKQLEEIGTAFNIINQLDLKPEEIPLPYDGRLDLAKAGLNCLYRFSSEFREKLTRHGFQFSTWSDVPRQSGLGGSSLFILLILGGLRALYDLDPYVHNDYVLAELTQRVEAKELGITCGYADRYVPLFGGLAYLDYRGKLQQKTIFEEPLTTYERLDPWVTDLPLFAISSGIKHNSGDVHGQMRPRYLDEYDVWAAQGGTFPPMMNFMQRAYETAWRGKIALLHKDWESFGALMNNNHQAVDDMMRYCGFDDGAGWANNLLIKTALQNGALGAKLTGAGDGGSVFALVHPDEFERLQSAWEKVCEQTGLNHAQIYRPHITTQGLVIKATKKD